MKKLISMSEFSTIHDTSCHQSGGGYYTFHSFLAIYTIAQRYLIGPFFRRPFFNTDPLSAGPIHSLSQSGQAIYSLYSR